MPALGRGLDSLVNNVFEILFCSGDRQERVAILQSHLRYVLRERNHNYVLEHSGAWSLYRPLRWRSIWFKVSTVCCSTIRNWASYLKNMLNLLIHSKDIQIFPTLLGLQIVTTDISGALLSSKGRKHFLQSITNWFSNPVKAVPLTNVFSATITMAFVDDWVLFYGPS